MPCSFLGTRVGSGSYNHRSGLSGRPAVLRRVQCQAKTTSGRKTTSGKKSSDRTAATSSAASGATSGKVPESSTLQKASSSKKPTAVPDKSLQERLDDFISYLTPKQEGDVGDLFMICLSMAVLVYLSMQLYRLYVYAYFTMDHYQNMMDMMS